MPVLKSTLNCAKIKAPRPGLVDIWNSFMAENAIFTSFDIPLCPTTSKKLPTAMITWDEAKAIYKRNRPGNKGFKYDAFVCFYIDDYKFDGPKGIWYDAEHTLKVLLHFSGVITPDFSTYQDFPEPLKIYATYRMRLFGFWLGKNGISVINNVRWGTEESYRYCFNGIPRNSIVCIGTVGGSPRKLIDRSRFNSGLNEMIRRLRPHTIIVYGSANYPCFEKLKKLGIKVVSYKGRTAKYWSGRNGNE